MISCAGSRTIDVVPLVLTIAATSGHWLGIGSSASDDQVPLHLTTDTIKVNVLDVEVSVSSRGLLSKPHLQDISSQHQQQELEINLRERSKTKTGSYRRLLPFEVLKFTAFHGYGVLPRAWIKRTSSFLSYSFTSTDLMVVQRSSFNSLFPSTFGSGEKIANDGKEDPAALGGGGGAGKDPLD
ncbi:hypothetical protein EV421DRAFT_1742436 [Armillaria borealis]|uniref:Uncharacterized protein n=1 Tax=Armillaria borealis TaxID=47425 RepID=A0AA39IZY3_9AGAR|nr:hypothetical protein EV421DRAFT_1742436 [Armillaria borealis]